MENVIITDVRTFLIKFAWTSTNGEFICTQDQLPNVIREYDPGRGIEFIKEFNPVKKNFKRVSKETILNYNYFPKDRNFLKSHSYFK